MAESFDDKALEALFAAAREDAAAEASPDLLARVMADAERVQAEQQIAQAAPQPAAEEAGGLWAAIWQTLGGWPSVSGVAMAGLAGLWIGVTSGTALMQDTLGLDLYGETAQTYLSALDVSYALTLGVEEE